jgi:small subunit ribosomal protein S4
MIIGPKYKICKRLGASVFEKCQTQKYQLAAERAPRRTRGKRGGGSDFGAQLLEKQKARFTYGLSESQFSRYVFDAMEKKGGSSASALMSRLEARLDNVVFRAGFARSRRMARQMVSHGHITVNGKRMTVPSHRVEVGDIVAARPESRAGALFANRTEQVAELRTPNWMELQEGGLGIKIVAEPTVGETELPFNAPVIIQFYSR